MPKFYPYNIGEYIKQQEYAYQQPIQVADGWEWSMKDHIKLTTLYKNSQMVTGKTDDKPFKNIMLIPLRTQYRTEGFDLKDIEIFVDDEANYFKSFLIKKFHEKWARENGINQFIDEMVESYVDYGGVLIKNIRGVRPEVVPWSSVAFCDQTDILSGPLGIKHFLNPDQLMEMGKAGWGDEANGADYSLEEMILLSENKKERDEVESHLMNYVPGPYVQVYEVHGILPESYLSPRGSPEKYVPQLHIVGLYQNQERKNQYVTLFKRSRPKNPFKFLARDRIRGRALGLGGAEELFEPQVWTNYDLIRMKGMLDAASKILYKTTDPNFVNRNKLDNTDNEEVLTLEEGRDIAQIDNFPRSLSLFDRSLAQWEQHAQQLASATEPLLGETPPSGTPFKSIERLVIEGKSMHEYRKSQISFFLDEVYKDWIIPHIAKEITKGTDFLADLDSEELSQVTKAIVNNRVNNFVKERVLNGELVFPEEIETQKNKVRQDFAQGGSKKYVKILAGEMKDAPLSVRVNIAGKQKDLSSVVDKFVNVFRQLIATPQILDDPRFAGLFNKILEASGISPFDFAFTGGAPRAIEPARTTEPIKGLAKVPKVL